jgi:hypothetical protein
MRVKNTFAGPIELKPVVCAFDDAILDFAHVQRDETVRATIC